MMGLQSPAGFNENAAAGVNGMGTMGGMMAGATANGMGMATMQPSLTSPTNMNTRPHDSTFMEFFSRNGRMARPLPQPGTEDLDPLFLPVEESIFDTSKEDSPREEFPETGGMISFNKGGELNAFKGS